MSVEHPISNYPPEHVARVALREYIKRHPKVELINYISSIHEDGIMNPNAEDYLFYMAQKKFPSDIAIRAVLSESEDLIKKMVEIGMGI